MKKIYFLLLSLPLFYRPAFSQCTPPSPPAISPASQLVAIVTTPQYNDRAYLQASGCSGTVNWSNGMTGANISFFVKSETSLTATCTVGTCESEPSEVAGIGIVWNNSPCDQVITVSSPLSSTYNKYEANNLVVGLAQVQPTASVVFSGENSVQLQPGFEAQNGSLFKAEVGGCRSLATRTVATGLSVPWEIIWGPDDHLWFTERPGRVGRINPVDGVRTLNFTVPDCSSLGEGGLLGMVLDPAFTTNNYLYIVYCYYLSGQPQTVQNYREKVVRYTYDGANNTLNSPFVLLENILGWSTHNGSRLQFGPDGKIYMTTGDAQALSTPQDDNALTGKILRMNADGSIPADNPIDGNYMWSKGHRNPQGLVFANGILYSSEHGPSTNDEMNIIEKGRNYGWPNVHGYCQDNTIGGEAAFCAANNIKEPIAAWTPTIATSGIDHYNNDAIPQWKNSILLGVLKDQRLKQLKLDPTGKYVIEMRDYFVNQFGRIRDVAIAPDGRVFICSDTSSNSIIEISGID